MKQVKKGKHGQREVGERKGTTKRDDHSGCMSRVSMWTDGWAGGAKGDYTRSLGVSQSQSPCANRQNLPERSGEKGIGTLIFYVIAPKFAWG